MQIITYSDLHKAPPKKKHTDISAIFATRIRNSYSFISWRKVGSVCKWMQTWWRQGGVPQTRERVPRQQVLMSPTPPPPHPAPRRTPTHPPKQCTFCSMHSVCTLATDILRLQNESAGSRCINHPPSSNKDV